MENSTSGPGLSHPSPRSPARLGLGLGLLLLAGSSANGSAVGTNAPAAPATGSTNAMQAAAVRGIGWLVANKDNMTLSYALKTFEKIHRATASEEIRRQMLGLIQEKSQALPAKTPTINLSHPEKLNWYELRPAIMDLIFLKSQGKPWEAEAEKLRQLFETQGDAILPAQVNLSERLVAAYKLQILGVPTGEIYTNTLAAIRAQGPAIRAANQRPDMGILYARAHVAFTASGYYSQYLNPAEYAPELECFDRTLEHFSHWTEMDASWADVASELVIGRKLLRQPESPHSKAMRERLLTQQNADGSWGGSGFSLSKVHHTVMAVLALIEFADEFRIGVDYL